MKKSPETLICKEFQGFFLTSTSKTGKLNNAWQLIKQVLQLGWNPEYKVVRIS
jgi:hypothetical protein